MNLDACDVSMVDGSGGSPVVATTIDLPDAELVAGDYFVICGDAANVPNCDLDVTPDGNLIQNGSPEAGALVVQVDGSVVDTVSHEGDTGAPYTDGSGAGMEDPFGDNPGICRW